MTEATAPYAIRRTLDVPFAEANRRVREALAAEGFGVLTEIDVAATLKKKLDVSFPPYVILGACNPPLAYRGLQLEPDLGLLLPCNVVLRHAGDGSIVVEALDPVAQMEVSGNPDILPVALEVRGRMERVVAAV